MENIEYRDNMQLWKIEAAAREAGYQKTDDCYWAQIFRNPETGAEFGAVREENSTNDPLEDLAAFLRYQKPRETREWDGTALSAAMAEELPPIPGMAPTAMTAALHADMELSARQHAPGVTCRLNRTTWRVEYIDAAGNLVI